MKVVAGATVGAALRGRPSSNLALLLLNGCPRRATPTVDLLRFESSLRRGGEVLVEEFGAGFEEVVGGDDAD